MSADLPDIVNDLDASIVRKAFWGCLAPTYEGGPVLCDGTFAIMCTHVELTPVEYRRVIELLTEETGADA